jgi:hypothetical protein
MNLVIHKEGPSAYNVCKVYHRNQKVRITSLPMMAMEGIGSNQGAWPKTPASKGLVHNKTNVAATISCIEWKTCMYVTY